LEKVKSEEEEALDGRRRAAVCAWYRAVFHSFSIGFLFRQWSGGGRPLLGNISATTAKRYVVASWPQGGRAAALSHQT